ncbi:hypothetical protein L6164_033331 [Bauhinia variegata]|uniref:Uncharacterized protein n=1 Tax=Bauhinia variegata TaxID=167791 RepID=A0ACB9KRI6_BAUVA|nr:hypothetical protein L6164_033331 [Bauhinia variegata]
MDHNEFNGTLKNGMFMSLNDVMELDISNNNLTGRLPAGWISKYGYFSVSRNDFEDEIPKELCQVDHLVINLSYNRFSGAIPSCLDSSFLKFIHLQGNSLTGTIPRELSRCNQLVTMDMRDNKLSGNIPKGIYRLQDLSFLLLGGNALQGQLPSELCPVPNQKQFGSFDESSYKGNPYLDFPSRDKGIAALPTPPRHSNGKGKNESAIDFTAFGWTFAASFVMVQLTMVVVLRINSHWRRTWFYFIETCLYKCCGRFLPYAFY